MQILSSLRLSMPNYAVWCLSRNTWNFSELYLGKFCIYVSAKRNQEDPYRGSNGILQKRRYGSNAEGSRSNNGISLQPYTDRYQKVF